jgi:hypothetical protein
MFDGKTERMSYYQASILRLAAAGVKGDTRAAIKFVETVNRTAEADLTRRLSTIQYMHHVDALAEENEQLRERSQQKTGVLVLPREPVDVNARFDDEDHLPDGALRRR